MHPHTSRSRSKTVCSIVVLKNNTVHVERKLCKYLAAVASPSGSRETISSPPLEDISIVSVGLWASWVCQFLPCNQLTPQHRARHCIASRFRPLLLWCFFPLMLYASRGTSERLCTICHYSRYGLRAVSWRAQIGRYESVKIGRWTTFSSSFGALKGDPGVRPVVLLPPLPCTAVWCKEKSF